MGYPPAEHGGFRSGVRRVPRDAVDADQLIGDVLRDLKAPDAVRGGPGQNRVAPQRFERRSVPWPTPEIHIQPLVLILLLCVVGLCDAADRLADGAVETLSSHRVKVGEIRRGWNQQPQLLGASRGMQEGIEPQSKIVRVDGVTKPGWKGRDAAAVEARDALERDPVVPVEDCRQK